MLEAFWWGAFGSSSLVIGAVFALRVQVNRLVLGLVMGFGAGVLLSAVLRAGRGGVRHLRLLSDVATGLFAGCAVYTLGDVVIDRLGGAERKSMEGGRRRDPDDARRHVMPEAFAYGGTWVGVVTTLGFATAFAISAFE